MKRMSLCCGLAVLLSSATAQTTVSPYTPGVTVEGVTYYLYSSLPAVSGYEFDETNENNEFVIESVNSEGKSVINVYYKASTITY
ncbi:MAG: hypothetical protein IIX35_01310, partial [Paraprevotella sp.]|nr:hypothetical protein [Paraprevotella sp.]